MEKHKLLSLVKKTANYFDDYSSPTSIYESLWRDPHFKPLLERMSPEDIVFYSFLIPINNKEQDIDETYDRIENNMYAVELVEIYDSEPELDCPECHNGHVNCDNCDGTGELECDRCDNTGQVDCSYCDGSGQDDEGEECSSCEGMGKKSCAYCYGSGYESCNYCGGDGDNICPTCDGDGKTHSDEKSEVNYMDYISWSPRWKDYFFRTKPDEEVDSEDAKNFGFNSQTLLLGINEEYSEDYTGYENGDILLYVTKDTKDLNLKIGIKRLLP